MDGIRSVAQRHRYARSFLSDEGKYVGRGMVSLIITISGNYSGVQAEGWTPLVFSLSICVITISQLQCPKCCVITHA